MENQGKEKDKKDGSFWSKMEGLMWLLLIYFALEAGCKWWWNGVKTNYAKKDYFRLTLFVLGPILLYLYIINNQAKY